MVGTAMTLIPWIPANEEVVITLETLKNNVRRAKIINILVYKHKDPKRCDKD
jgi:hypothetical protein